MLAVIDARMPQTAQNTLISLGYELIPLPICNQISQPVQGHPDLLLFFAPEYILTTPGYAKNAAHALKIISDRLKKPIRLTEKELSPCYPEEAMLCTAAVGNKLFFNRLIAARELQEDKSFEKPLHVKQGYTKCSTVIVNDHALITADPSVKAAAENCGISVCNISPGAVTLPGYSEGFLGGASSFFPYLKTPPHLLFCGNLDLHPDAERIKSFCLMEGVEVISLSQDPLYDVGTIFII